MAELVLGPLLRYVGERDATVWVETDAPCEVDVLGHTARTFRVRGHHFALVVIDGLEPGESHPYEVLLDGERCWPLTDQDVPQSTIRTLEPGAELTIAYGSCRVAMPHTPPYSFNKDEDERGFDIDALYILAKEMIRGTRDNWPEVLVLLGDQVYVDEGSPVARAKVRWARDTTEAPHEETATFEEYTWLYQESWGEPTIRWLLSTISTSMIWDDHDMRDDWNISESWVEEMNQLDWWRVRAVDGFMSYWIYQHLGNLSPAELQEDEIWQRVQGEHDDATAVLQEFAERASQTGEGTRWSFCRDLDRTRLIVMDSRAGRVLDEGRRTIVDDEEWDWIVDKTRGDFDHLLLATSDPYLLVEGLHHLEAWNERVCDGAWGGYAAKLGEKMRREVDFDHWGSFNRSFEALSGLLERIGSGRDAPASIVVLSGDVHHAYLAEVAFKRSAGVRSAVYQATCSPFRNPLDANERRVIEAMTTGAAAGLTRLLARSAGVSDPSIRWRLCEGPYFDNQVGTLKIDRRRMNVRLDKTKPEKTHEKSLERTFERRIA